MTGGLDAAGLAELPPPSPAAIRRRRAARHPGLIIGGAVVLLFAAAALAAPVLAPADPYSQNLGARLIDPAWAGGTWLHPFGTDALGRDLLSRLLYGARVTMLISACASLLSAAIGAGLGIVGGYFGGRVDNVVSYLISVKLSLPPLLVALALVSVVGSSIPVLILIIGGLAWDRYAVVTRAATQQLRNRDYVAAARAVGASSWRIVTREVLPNLAGQIIVIASLELAVVILIESVLSFLGLGVRPPIPSWGLLIAEGRAYMFFKPWLIMIPGTAIFALVVAINLAGDGLRDVLAAGGRD